MQKKENAILEKCKHNIFIIKLLVEREKKIATSSTFMGALWDIANPLIHTVVLVWVFGRMFGNGKTGTFPIYVLTGTVINGLFTSGTTLCLGALSSNKNFLLKTRLDKEIFVLEKVFLALRNFGLSVIAYFVVTAFYRITPTFWWLIVIPDILLLTLMIIGIGKILAVINVVFADITYFYNIFTLAIMYGSALFYRAEMLSPSMQKIIMINPVYLSITIARNAIMEKKLAPIIMWIILLGYSFGLYIIGKVLFEKGTKDIVAKM